MTSEEALALAERAYKICDNAYFGPWTVREPRYEFEHPTVLTEPHDFEGIPLRHQIAEVNLHGEVTNGNANFIAASRTLVPDLAAAVRELAERLALAMTFVPEPSEMSGFDDDGCDGQTAATIRAACWLHGVPVPEHCRVSGAVEGQEPKESQPAWHDHPTCFGRWISDGGLVRPVFDSEDIETCVAICIGWYGPIPERPTTSDRKEQR